ncbi:M48 family metallopeptidase [Parasediminibacterium sp. JCM 36343]|uniref:M48 family metallopeptidase n=1 Tax=Parasediminibacterium sp. JCM 36343 TaxID=3374279 RepID=UPI00397931A6
MAFQQPNAQFNLFEKGDTINLGNKLPTIKHRYEQENDALTGPNRKYIADIYTQGFKNIKELFDKGELINNTKACNYLRSLTDKIVKANPALQNMAVDCFFSKSSAPNAYSAGNGVFVFNAGLFYKLDNESQVAFVICHELSHIYFNHGEKRINHYITTLYSDEVQKQLRNIQKQEFKQRQALENLSKGFTFDNKRHSRDHEQEADSMAVVFMANTNFDVNGAITALAILDTIDGENSNTAQFLAETFNSPAYPFQKKWLSKEDGLLGGHAALEVDKAMEDSLKTHPDCKVRIKALAGAVAKNNNSTRAQNPVNDSLFHQLQRWMPYETIEYFYSAKHYSPALYFTLQTLKAQHPNNILVTYTGNILNAIYASQKKHQIGKCIEMPSPGYSADYNSLLQFITNLYTDEIAGISYHFLKQYQQQFSTDKDFQYTLTTSKQNFN